MDRSLAPTQSFRPGTLAGAGSFRCEGCGFAVSLQELDAVPGCPHCGRDRFQRSSIFGDHAIAEPWGGGRRRENPEWLAEAREALVTDGDYLAYRDDERVHVVPVQEGWTRVGRSLAAQVHFDDPTVSRRHALIHREEGDARVLDDRSLNGVFVNGERTEWHPLEDGDEVLIGRFRLYYVRIAEGVPAAPGERAGSFVG